MLLETIVGHVLKDAMTADQEATTAEMTDVTVHVTIAVMLQGRLVKIVSKAKRMLRRQKNKLVFR
jgi:hypothetical protein